jgi:hypothetical protein
MGHNPDNATSKFQTHLTLFVRFTILKNSYLSQF